MFSLCSSAASCKGATDLACVGQAQNKADTERPCTATTALKQVQVLQCFQLSCSLPAWFLAWDWLVVPCNWVDEPAAQDVVPVRPGGCVVQQRLASQLVALGETVLHGVCSQPFFDL